MNFYVSLINSTIDYIEENIGERLTLEEVSKHFSVSEFHFNRMFKTVVGKTLKQYILGRKLTRAFERLSATEESVIDIAYDFGFEYPEVFSRAFKKQFGVSPNICRIEKPQLGLVKKAAVVERQIISCQGSLALKGTFKYLEGLHLKGWYVEVDANSKEFEPKLRASADAFLKEVQGPDYLGQGGFYTVVNCHGEDNGEYTVFYGVQGKPGVHAEAFKGRIVPEGWYASFVYCGDMFDIREAFIDDLYRWVMVREVELNPNGVGMLNIFGKDYGSTGSVQILVPVKEPK